MAMDKDRERMDRQREQRLRSEEPIPYAGRGHEPGERVAGHTANPDPHTGRDESADMAVESTELRVNPTPPRATRPTAADTGLSATGHDEEYERAGHPRHGATMGQKLGVRGEAPGEQHDPPSPGVGPVPNWLFGLIVVVVVFVLAYLLYQTL